MKTKVLRIGLIVVIGGVVAAVILNRKPDEKVVSVTPQQVAPPLAQQTASPAPTVALPQPKPLVETKPPPVETKPAPHPVKTQVQQPAPPPGPRQLADPDARVALAFVGVDPDAEAYWEEAIFDPGLPDKERDDLMEDLNEVGFADPKNPGPDDLPLILNRLALIEQLAPYTDEFMARHLGEAYKDLMNMAARATRNQ
jgi:hypothetical protein